MRTIIMIFFCNLVIFQLFYENSIAQLEGQARIDSLLIELPKISIDSNGVNLLVSLSNEFSNVAPSEGIKFGERGLTMATKIRWNLGIAKSYHSLGVNYSGNKTEYVRALEYYHDALKIYEKLLDKNGIAAILHSIGIIYNNKSDYSLALEYYNRALKINEEMNNKRWIANNLTNIGNISSKLSDYSKALENYHKALKINEELKNKSGIAKILGNIGLIYNNQSNHTKALDYFLEALKIDEELEDKSGIARHVSNIGMIYLLQADYPKALEYYQKALVINGELGRKRGLAINLGNIGIIYDNQGDYPKALEYYHKALEIEKEIENKFGIALHLGNMGSLYYSLSQDSVLSKVKESTDLVSLDKEVNINRSISNFKESIKIFEELGELHTRSEFYKNLSNAFVLKGDYQNAFEAFNVYKTLQDSVFSIDKQKEIANLESIRELEIKEKENQLLIKDNQLFNSELLQKNQKISLAEKEKEVQHLAFLKEQAERQEKEKQLSLSETQMKLQQSQIETLDKDKERQNAELKAKNLQRNFFIGGVIVSLILFFIAFIRFREKKKLSERLEKQKNEIESQKSLLEEKNNEIVDSINYAATIQNALLPWASVLNKSLNEHFIFYKPKNIVSGDSYWFKEVDGIKYLAVIDCTGHGVPGSMLTVIANSVLDDAVLSKKLSSTSEILTYMNEKVTEALNQRLAENSIRDGMEVALIAIHQDKVQFSGAGRPLYIKNGTLEIIKTDKRGIAGSSKDDNYQFNSIVIEKTEGKILYLTTDGFADQMNEEGKKYSTRRFISLIESISEKPLSEQFELLNGELLAHQGNKHQIDDITIVGLRI